MTTIELKFNGIPSLQRQLPGLVQERIDELARQFRERIIASLENGSHGLSADTGAYGESIYIASPFGSDYDERVRAAGAALLTNPSRWREFVQEKFPRAYSASNFAARVGPEAQLPDDKNMAIAVVATFWAVAFYWEFGHNNQFTGKYEHRPVMGPEADQFREAFAAGFQGLFDGVVL